MVFKRKFQEVDERLQDECEARIEEKQEAALQKQSFELKLKQLNEELVQLRKINQMMSQQQNRMKEDNRTAIEECTGIYERQI